MKFVYDTFTESCQELAFSLCSHPNPSTDSCHELSALGVEIVHGRVTSKGAEALPEKASRLFTILNPPPLSQLRPIGLVKGQFTVPDDFNAPLSEDVLQTFESKRGSCWIPANFFGSWPVMPGYAG